LFHSDQLGFLTTPTNLTVNDINNLALLDCNTTNLFNEMIQFTWFNGSNPVPLGAGPNVQLAGSRNERLVIPSVQITDIGQYSCQVARIYNASYSQSITAFIYLSVVGMSHSSLYGGSVIICCRLWSSYNWC